jgi:hypothetical protein
MSNRHKDIKRLVCKKLEKNYPNFKRLSKKVKKQITQKVLAEVYANYDMSKAVEADKYELCHVEPIPKDIYNLNQIKELHDDFNDSMLAFKLKSNVKAIKDPELLAIDKMVDWPFVNHLLAPDNYFAAGHTIFPVQLFKAELLKSLKYQEISYRKYCNKEINTNERKENRAFIGLKSTQKINHSQLSQFRSGLPFNKLINVMVYSIHLFLKEKPLSKNTFYAVDSTELAERISNFPLAKLKVGNKQVRIYQDIYAECGSRRLKRDKSSYVVGYRLHTLTVIDAEKEMAFPLLSILAPANHHDSNFLEMLVDFGKAIGLDLNVVIGDQAYGDKEESEYIQTKHSVTILNQPKQRNKLPEFVDSKTYHVYLNAYCETQMDYCGKTKVNEHEFYCGAEPGQCPLEHCCERLRHIPIDSGVFGQIPYYLDEAQKALNMRKVAERPFNLLKHREGLEPLRTIGQKTSTTVATIANVATLLIEIAGYRKKKKKTKKEQLYLFAKAA